MKDVTVTVRTVVVIDGHRRVRDMAYQGRLDERGVFHLRRCSGKFTAQTNVKEQAQSRVFQENAA